MYHSRVILATAKRILRQLSHDHRTIGLMLVAPIILMALLKWIFSDSEGMFDTVAPALLGIFPFVIMFLVTSITTLRERTGGTLERLMAMPSSKFDIILGYAVAFGIFGALQSVIVSSVAIYILGLDIAGPQWFMIVVAIADTFLGVALGLLVSAFAKTEFQAVQFLPIFILPQLLLCGLFVPLERMPEILESIAYFLPVTYAVEALVGVIEQDEVTSDMWQQLAVIILFIIGAITIASMTLRRRTD